MTDSRVDPFDAARERLRGAKRRRRPREQAPETIVPVLPAVPDAEDGRLTPDRLDRARAHLRSRIPPPGDEPA